MYIVVIYILYIIINNNKETEVKKKEYIKIFQEGKVQSKKNGLVYENKTPSPPVLTFVKQKLGLPYIIFVELFINYNYYLIYGELFTSRNRQQCFTFLI